MVPRRASPQAASSRLSYADAVCVVWFALDAFTHLAIEGSYVALALGPTAAKSSSLFAAIWREYGKADARWAVRDANVISLELLTVFLGGPAAVAMVHAIITCALPAKAHPAGSSALMRVCVTAGARRGATCCRRCCRWRSCTADG